MRKFAVVSGFLGSGKTTTMMALTKYYTEHFGGAAMISNDLGAGVTLADHRHAVLSGCNASEITDDCICFLHEDLAAQLDGYYENGCELVLSDIPGFGVGALEHVYHGLTEKFPGRFDLATFTVLTEPETVRTLRSEPGSDRGIICGAQLMEADLIVLSKADLLDDAACEDALRWLQEQYPEAKAIAVSALRGDGLEELSRELREGSASLRHPDIDYDAAPLQNAMDRISEYYLQYHATVCCNTFDGTEYLREMALEIRERIRGAGCEIPHMKLLAWGPEGDFGKVDILGTGRPIEVSRPFAEPCTELAVVINTSAVCPAKLLDGLAADAVREVSDRYRLELMIFKKQCFGLGDE